MSSRLFKAVLFMVVGYLIVIQNYVAYIVALCLRIDYRIKLYFEKRVI